MLRQLGLRDGNFRAHVDAEAVKGREPHAKFVVATNCCKSPPTAGSLVRHRYDFYSPDEVGMRLNDVSGTPVIMRILKLDPEMCQKIFSTVLSIGCALW